ncbi:MAG: hypothetical protein KDD37_07595 [Bdellovibrionales bacterium]|nr:hypothetical protein [Bdellovibrionales bacterium]
MRLAITLLVSLFFSLSTYAATVTSVKGKNVIISLSDESVSRGQKVELFDSNGKKRGIIQITKTNKSGTKALGKLIVGKAQKGWGTDSGQDATMPREGKSSKKQLRYGGIVGFSMDSMEVTLEDSKADLSGTGYSIKGIFDFPFSESFQFRGRVGAEFFSASGDAASSVCTSCDVDITYLTAEGMAQYYINNSKYSFWVGAGGAIAMPSSSSSNAIDTDSLDTTSLIQVAGGFDIKTTSGYIPVEIIYAILPKSDSVSGSYVSIGIGYMW